jgi:hypothetical protein
MPCVQVIKRAEVTESNEANNVTSTPRLTCSCSPSGRAILDPGGRIGHAQPLPDRRAASARLLPVVHEQESFDLWAGPPARRQPDVAGVQRLDACWAGMPLRRPGVLS